MIEQIRDAILYDTAKINAIGVFLKVIDYDTDESISEPEKFNEFVNTIGEIIIDYAERIDNQLSNLEIALMGGGLS